MPSPSERIVLITGGSQGLGWTMASGFLRSGYRVAITAAPGSEDALAERENEVRGSSNSRQLIGAASDVSDPDACTAVIDWVRSEFGRAPDILVNNAARGPADVRSSEGGDPKLWEVDARAWDRMTSVNIDGPFFMSRAAVPSMIAQGFGRVICISTSWPTMVLQGYGPYGIAKAALETFVAVLAKDLAGTGVTANVLLPGGACATPMATLLGLGGPGSTLLDPDIMIEPALWLASDDASDWTSRRIIAKNWPKDVPAREAAETAASPRRDEPAII